MLAGVGAGAGVEIAQCMGGLEITQGAEQFRERKMCRYLVDAKWRHMWWSG